MKSPNDVMLKTLVDILMAIENLPYRICNEMERRESIKNAERMKKLQNEMDCLHEHNVQLNKIMFGYENPPVDNNNERIQPLEGSQKENSSSKD